MSALHVIALGGCIICTTIAQLCMKYGAVKSASVQKSLMNPLVLFAYGLFGIVTVLFVYVMQQIELKVVNAWTATTYILVIMGSIKLFGERVLRLQWLGVALVLCGMGFFFII